jgi:uncharacterized cupredoxin-like copper-binding protein
MQKLEKLKQGSLALILMAVFGLAGCGDDDDDSPSTPGTTTVNITLDEFTVAAAPGSVKAGTVDFAVKNSGAEVHEFVVVKTDLSIAQLPKSADGSFDEAGAGVTAVDEIEDIPAGATQHLTVSLAAGHYVLVCNIVEGNESHFHEGMVADFMVQ